MTWPNPEGIRVDAVREQLTLLRKGQGSFEDLVTAVQDAKFAVKPTARSIDALAANWDYQRMQDTWTDTIQAALFQNVITLEQYEALLKVAAFTGPEPSRS